MVARKLADVETTLIEVRLRAGRVQVESLKFTLLDTLADLLHALAGHSHPVSVETFLQAGGANSSMRTLKAAMQALVAKCTVAAAVAGHLVQHSGDLCYVLIDLHLVRMSEVVACELASREQRGQLLYVGGRCRIIGRYIVARVGPLRKCSDRQQTGSHTGKNAFHDVEPLGEIITLYWCVGKYCILLRFHLPANKVVVLNGYGQKCSDDDLEGGRIGGCFSRGWRPAQKKGGMSGELPMPGGQ